MSGIPARGPSGHRILRPYGYRNGRRSSESDRTRKCRLQRPWRSRENRSASRSDRHSHVAGVWCYPRRPVSQRVLGHRSALAPAERETPIRVGYARSQCRVQIGISEGFVSVKGGVGEVGARWGVLGHGLVVGPRSCRSALRKAAGSRWSARSRRRGRTTLRLSPWRRILVVEEQVVVARVGRGVRIGFPGVGC